MVPNLKDGWIKKTKIIGGKVRTSARSEMAGNAGKAIPSPARFPENPPFPNRRDLFPTIHVSTTSRWGPAIASLGVNLPEEGSGKYFAAAAGSPDFSLPFLVRVPKCLLISPSTYSSTIPRDKSYRFGSFPSADEKRQILGFRFHPLRRSPADEKRRHDAGAAACAGEPPQEGP